MSQLQVIRMFLIPTRDNYQEQFQRSFNISADVSTIERLSNLANKHRRGSLPITEISSELPNLAGLSPMPLGAAEIPNGWNTQRLRFLLEVETPISATGTIVSYIQGYSEYHDPSLTGVIDPKMLFHINSITEVIKMIDPVTKQCVMTPRNMDTVITGGSDELNATTSYGGFPEINTPAEELYLIRPKDIYEVAIDLTATMHDTINGDMSVYNNAGHIGAGSMHASNRLNADPVGMIHKTINGHLDSYNSNSFGSNHDDIMKNAAGLASESNLMSNSFIYAIHRATGSFQPTSFNLETLDFISPGVSDRITLIENSANNAHNMGLLGTNDTASTMNPTPEVMKAVTITQIINSIMLNELISSLTVHFTNASGSGLEPTVMISDIKSFMGDIDLQMRGNKIISSIRSILIPQISDSGYTMFEISLSADILGDTNITISLNAQPAVPFRFPTFADALTVPVVGNITQRSAVTDDLCHVFDAVTDGVDSSADIQY